MKMPKAAPKPIDPRGGWLTEYEAFHKRMRKDPAYEFTHGRYLIVEQGKGGLADRIKSMPYYLWLAAKHDRILLWYWDSPCSVDHYFQPSGDIDWRVRRGEEPWFDEYLDDKVRDRKVMATEPKDKHDYFTHYVNDAEMESRKGARYISVIMNHASLTKGLPELYHAHGDNPEVFKILLERLFKPSDAVQTMLNQRRAEMRLVPDRYVGVHLRARYPGINDVLKRTNPKSDTEGFTNVTPEVEAELLKMSMHAIECTMNRHDEHKQHIARKAEELQRQADELRHQLRSLHVYETGEPAMASVATAEENQNGLVAAEEQTDTLSSSSSPQGLPVYFATDTMQVLKLLEDSPDSHHSVRSLPPSDHEKTHFVLGRKGRNECSEFYETIVDLYLLKESACIGMGVGGYSMLATMMNGMKCFVFHQHNSMIERFFDDEGSFFHTPVNQAEGENDSLDKALPTCVEDEN